MRRSLCFCSYVVGNVLLDSSGYGIGEGCWIVRSTLGRFQNLKSGYGILERCCVAASDCWDGRHQLKIIFLLDHCQFNFLHIGQSSCFSGYFHLFLVYIIGFFVVRNILFVRFKNLNSRDGFTAKSTYHPIHDFSIQYKDRILEGHHGIIQKSI